MGCWHRHRGQRGPGLGMKAVRGQVRHQVREQVGEEVGEEVLEKCI